MKIKNFKMNLLLQLFFCIDENPTLNQNGYYIPKNMYDSKVNITQPKKIDRYKNCVSDCLFRNVLFFDVTCIHDCNRKRKAPFNKK